MIGCLVFLIGALAVLVGFVGYFYRRDQRYLKGRTRDALSQDLQEEIVEEIDSAKKRHDQFKQALENAAKLSKSQDNSLTSDS